MGRVIAIDYGTKRTGIAVTDPMKIIAHALDTIDTKDIFNFLNDYLQNENVETIVVGFPLNLQGKETNATQHVKGFVRKLKKSFPGINIEITDERYSSKLALQAMITAGVKKSQRKDKKNLDKISATIILQNYLNHIV
ncbi:MAG: Holliday junction resolvase RuvX [Marinilabiliales bacterium]